jgi:hypothetical protein
MEGKRANQDLPRFFGPCFRVDDDSPGTDTWTNGEALFRQDSM